MLIGSMNQYNVIPAIPRPHSAAAQQCVVKPVVSIPFDLPSRNRLIHNTIDTVQRVVVSPLFKVPLPLSKKQINSCNICHRRFNSQSQAEAHYKGNKHARMTKGREAIKPNQAVPAIRDNITSTDIVTTCSPATASTEPSIDTRADGSLLTVTMAAGAPVLTSADAEIASGRPEVETAKLLSCQLCKVDVNSVSQLEAHNGGTKHQAMVDAQNGLGPIKAYSRQPSNHHTQKTNSGLQEKIFHCYLCDVSVNSEVKLKQHISSRKHRERVAGKFPKPKFSKDLHNVPAQAMLLPRQKEFLVETRVLHNPTTGAMPFASPLPSLPPAAAPAIFQVPPMVHWLHQPPLGPMRISHGAMLFTPY